jgi:hypothetical protein
MKTNSLIFPRWTIRSPAASVVIEGISQESLHFEYLRFTLDLPVGIEGSGRGRPSSHFIDKSSSPIALGRRGRIKWRGETQFVAIGIGKMEIALAPLSVHQSTVWRKVLG